MDAAVGKCNHVWCLAATKSVAADLGKDGAAAHEGAFIGRWQWNFLADAMDHQSCLSELKGVGSPRRG